MAVGVVASSPQTCCLTDGRDPREYDSEGRLPLFVSSRNRNAEIIVVAPVQLQSLSAAATM